MTPTPYRTAAGLILLVAVLAFTSGCAFDRNWKRLGAVAADEAAGDPLAGRWEGTWTSESTKHTGKLRAIVTPAGSDAYRADFDATYMGIMRFGYSMTLAATRDADANVTHFTGQEDLGWLAGGVYRYDGAADGQTFDCAYESKHDRGRFQMTRPLPRN